MADRPVGEISPSGDATLYRRTIANLARQLLSNSDEGRCVFFLGSGMAWDHGPHLPTGTELSRELAEAIELSFPKPVPLPTVAFYYEFYNKREGLNQFLVDRLTDASLRPSKATVHLATIIHELEKLGKQPLLLITTNYDQHFELAYKELTGRFPTVVVYNGGRDANEEHTVLHSGHKVSPLLWQIKGTCLYKLHGCISDPGDKKATNLVITEDDYINFLSNCLHQDNRKRIHGYVLGRLSESTILFLGYSLSDWNFRVIYKTTTEKRHRDCYAVQLPSEEDKPYWNALVRFWTGKSCDLINHTAEAFLADLLAAIRQQSATEAGARESTGVA